MDNLPGKHFRLGKSIDMTPTTSWFGGKGFSPIGRTMHFGFYGSLDGNGFEIQNLTLKTPDNFVGLFGQAGGGYGFWINNLKLNTTTLQNPGDNSGSLIGMGGCAILSGVESTSITMNNTKSQAGGLIGYANYETKILYSKTSGSLITTTS
jgi:hypothetical protein